MCAADQQAVALLVADLTVQEGQSLSTLDSPGVDDNLIIFSCAFQKSDVKVHRHTRFKVIDIVSDKSISRYAIDKSAGEATVETATFVQVLGSDFQLSFTLPIATRNKCDLEKGRRIKRLIKLESPGVSEA